MQSKCLGVRGSHFGGSGLRAPTHPCTHGDCDDLGLLTNQGGAATSRRSWRSSRACARSRLCACGGGQPHCGCSRSSSPVSGVSASRGPSSGFQARGSYVPYQDPSRQHFLEASLHFQGFHPTPDASIRRSRGDGATDTSLGYPEDITANKACNYPSSQVPHLVLMKPSWALVRPWSTSKTFKLEASHS